MSRLERDARIEWIKLLAIFAVAFQHLVHAKELGFASKLTHGAVPAFAFLSVFFAVRSGRTASDLTGWLRARALRLYGLFLVWNTLYLVVRLTAARGGAPSSFDGFSWLAYLVFGYDNALWFIPFILVANSLAGAAGRLSRAWPSRLRSGLIIALVVGAGVLACSESFAAWRLDPVMLGIGRKAVPAVLLGMAAGLSARQLDGLMVPGRWGVAVALGGLLLGGYLMREDMERTTYLAETLLGLAGIGLGLRVIRADGWQVPAELSLFIFVAHSMFIQVMRKGSHFLGLDWDRSGWVVNLGVFAALGVAMCAVYFVIRNTLLGRLAMFRIPLRKRRVVAEEA